MSFLDYDLTSSNQLEHRTLQKGKEYFNFPNHQIYNHSKSQASQYKISVTNSYDKSFHTSGGFLDFDLKVIYKLLLDNFIFAFELEENNTSANEVINGSMMIEKISILQQGQSISSYDGFWLWVKNNIDLDSLTFESSIMSSNGTLTTDFKKGITIPQNGKHKFYIELESIISKLYL